MAELVVLGPFLRIGKHLVGFGQFLETVLCNLIAGILVGMILDSESSVGLLDLGFGSVAVNLEDFVIIAFFTVCQNMSFCGSGLWALGAGKNHSKINNAKG